MADQFVVAGNGGMKGDEESPMAKFSSGEDSDLEASRHGNWVTGVFHIITAVVGAGVLSLSYSIAQLGWIGGMLVLLAFAGITWYTTRLLADVCLVNGVRQRSYMGAVRTLMGETHCRLLACVQYFNLFLTAIAYNITGATSMSNVAKTYCNAEGEGCFDKYWVFCVIFGGAQLVLSQLPNMDSLWVVSAVGMFTSFAYSIIALALAINEGSSGESSIHGVPNTPAGKMWSVFNAMGAIVFAYSFSFILVEITDTMRSAGRGPVFHIKRAVNVSMVIITSFYIAVAVSGYVAFGNEVCGNIISCFTTPVWLIRATNIFVLIHMLPAYQVFSQPLFEFLQRQMASVKAFPPWVASVAFRIVFRSAYVAFVAFISVCLPFFSDIVGLIGAIGFWPATVFYPIEMYIRYRKPGPTARYALEALNVLCFLVTVCAIAGSVQLIVADSADYEVFGS
ncbi:Amino acid permease 5 [Auxenochlorella protothecoides]|uniref:Amino acid permease 5 n=1 Tax=Auxenochlorella protothecoides TaxID=3075 RepID=A0A087SHN5_AUXPR|nr:Amino acid permease 5 [Auxenochlorella protothecoides]KFM25239.1 Amino acid permease 5 [Auxenochlorella protothecoides]RMZ57652.1 hypothetical protein APUTEX25_001852 [Auxenochlorella protothecoides]|eukprot:RMZ57652.1 hypothetical protein APUTEX25_001852 [Auxenochlorella protothecoides]